MGLPLEGVRVVDLTLVWAGPYCTMLLADWGAEVIRVEPHRVFLPYTRGFLPKPTPEAVRAQRNFYVAYPNWDPGQRPWNRHPSFNSHARNKKSVTMDLRTPEGRDAFFRLVALSDVVVENNAPDTMDRLGITYEALRRVRPDLILLRMPAFGLSGPYRNYRAFGAQMECVTGHTSIRGYPDEPPDRQGDVFTADAVAGLLGAFAVVSALRQRRRTGRGQQIELAQAEAFLQALAPHILEYTVHRRLPRRLGNRHPWKAPHGLYPCREPETWVTLSVGTDEEFRGLCRAMGRPDLAQDPRFADSLSRYRHQDDLDPEITAWTATLTAWEATSALWAEGVPAGPVMTEADLLADPHLEERGFFQPLTQEDAGTYRYPGPLWKSARIPNRLRTPPVRLGEHNRYVYCDLLGYSEADLARLEAEGKVGQDLLLEG